MPKPSRGTFQYQRRTREDVQARATQQSGNYDSIFKERCKVFRPKDGKNVIRILPPTWEDPRHYGYEIFVNYGIGVDNQSYLSLSKMLQKPDPLEDAKKAADKDGDRKLSDALSAKKRVVWYVIDRNDEEAGPQLWAAPWTVDRDVANLTIDEDTKEVIWIDDPENGFDLRFYKEGKGRNTEYNPSKMKLLAQSPIHQDEGLQDEWMELVKEHPIPSCLNFYSYDHISTMFDGQARVEKEDPEETGEKPAARTRRGEQEDPPPRASRRADPDPEPDPPPRARRRADPEPDPEDPPPRTRRRADPEEEAPADPEERPSVRERLRSRLQEEPATASAPPPRRRADPEPEPEQEEDPPPRARRRADPEPDPEDPPPRRRARA